MIKNIYSSGRSYLTNFYFASCKFNSNSKEGNKIMNNVTKDSSKTYSDFLPCSLEELNNTEKLNTKIQGVKELNELNEKYAKCADSKELKELDNKISELHKKVFESN